MKPARPAWPLALFEPGRTLGEISLMPFGKIPLRFAPSGDGHPVLVCPGFLGSDLSTGPLRRFIASKGYDVFGWEQGANLGPGPDGHTVDRLEQRAATIVKQTGRDVTLVGWSLGGVFMRELAKRIPDQVRQVITLGSPICGDADVSNVSWLYTRIAGPIAPADEVDNFLRKLRTPPDDVPSTAIFTKTDGIVAWRGCIEPQTSLTDNIEVLASHCGLGFNPFVFYAIADRLTQQKENWSPFDREATAWRRFAYPTSGHGYK